MEHVEGGTEREDDTGLVSPMQIGILGRLTAFSLFDDGSKKLL